MSGFTFAIVGKGDTPIYIAEFGKLLIGGTNIGGSEEASIIFLI